MPATLRPAGVPPAARDWPTYWFTRLEEALTAGDFEAVAAAGRELRRLGVAVSYPRPSLSAPPTGKAVTCG